MHINGFEVTRQMYQKALQQVFDAIPKGKFASVMRAASVVEVVGKHAFALDETGAKAATVIEAENLTQPAEEK